MGSVGKGAVSSGQLTQGDKGVGRHRKGEGAPALKPPSSPPSSREEVVEINAVGRQLPGNETINKIQTKRTSL